MPYNYFRMIDFHSHSCASDWFPSISVPATDVLAHTWPLLVKIEAQPDAMDEAGIDAKVLSAPMLCS
jgi:hypothetical protein